MTSNKSSPKKFSGDTGLESLSPPPRPSGTRKSNGTVAGPFTRDRSLSPVGSRLQQLRQEDTLAREKAAAKVARDADQNEIRVEASSEASKAEIETSFGDKEWNGSLKESLDNTIKDSIDISISDAERDSGRDKIHVGARSEASTAESKTFFGEKEGVSSSKESSSVKMESGTLGENQKDFKTDALGNRLDVKACPIPSLTRAEYRHVQPGAVAINGTQSNDDYTIDIGSNQENIAQNVLNSTAVHVVHDIVVPEATLVPENENVSRQSVQEENRLRKQRRILIAIVVTVVVAAAITVGVVLGTRSGDSSDLLGPCGDGIVGNGICLDGLCCSEFGFCGSTSDFCGDGTLVNSTSGFCGDGIVGNGTCADGLCCSEFGFCGSTAEFCTNEQELPGANDFCGNGVVGNGTCVGGLCCSEFGFCGITPEHCVNGQTPP